MTIEKYVAINNPQEAAKVIYELGAPKVTSNQDLLSKLNHATKQFGDKAFEKLAQIETPYRSLILTYSEKKSNCSGDCKCSEKKSGCCGGASGVNGAQDANWELPNYSPMFYQNPSVNNNSPKDSSHILLIAGIVILGIIVVAKIV